MCDIFKAVVSVLVKEGTPNENINNAIHAIHKAYSAEQLTTVKSSLIDYSEIAFQDAYIYLYFTSHVYVIDNLFEIFWENEEVRAYFTYHFKRSLALNVCAIGGGPGSEIFGLNLFMQKYFGHVDVLGTVLDRHPSWRFTYNELVNKLGVFNLSGVQYQQFEFFEDTSNPAIKNAVASADVVFIIKFISAVSCDQSLCENKFSELLYNAKPDTIILFVDNAGGDYSKIMDRIAVNANLQQLQSISHHVVNVPPMELDNMLSNPTPLKSPPQNNAAVRASIWFKNYQSFWQDDFTVPHNSFVGNDQPLNLNLERSRDPSFDHDQWANENSRNGFTNYEAPIPYRDETCRYKHPLLPLPILDNSLPPLCMRFQSSQPPPFEQQRSLPFLGAFNTIESSYPPPLLASPPPLQQQLLPPLHARPPLLPSPPLTQQQHMSLPLLPPPQFSHCTPTTPPPQWFTPQNPNCCNEPQREFYHNDESVFRDNSVYDNNNNLRQLQNFEPDRNIFYEERQSGLRVKRHQNSRRNCFNGAQKCFRKAKRVSALRNIVLKIRTMADKLTFRRKKKYWSNKKINQL